MADDVRTSRSPMSDYVMFGDGDEGPFGVLEMRGEETFSMDTIRLQYADSATESLVVTVYDGEHDIDDTADGDEIDAFLMEPGDEISLDNVTYDDIHDGVVADAEDDQDGDVVVSVGGMKVTG